MDPQQQDQLRQLYQLYQQQQQPPRMLDESIDPPPDYAMQPQMAPMQQVLPDQRRLQMPEVNPYQQRPWDPQRNLYQGA